MSNENEVTQNEPLESTPATEETTTEQEVPATPETEGKPVGEATIVEMDSPADIFPPAEEQA